MHLGHRALIERATRLVVIEKGGNLTPGEERCRYSPIECTFFKLSKIAHLTSNQFISLLKERFKPIGVVVGEDFRFGKGRQGGIDTLARHFPVEVVPEVKVAGIPVHTRTIRYFLQQGEVKKGMKLLGRFYSILANPIPGQGIGKKLLYPTINLSPDRRFLLPKKGVYLMLLNEEPGVGFIGIRSTDLSFTIEVHLFNFKANPIPPIRLHFCQFIRPAQRFTDLDNLRHQIKRDLSTALHLWKLNGSKITKIVKGENELRHRYLGW